MRATVTKSKLIGNVTISGAKNNSLRLLVASLLTSGKLTLENCPINILDLQIQVEMLKVLGKTVSVIDDIIVIEEKSNLESELIWTKRSIRNTLLILGCLLAREGRGKVPLPGGCKLGDRKYDIHIEIMEKLGAKVWEEEGYLCAESKTRLKGTNLYLPIRSTGATENGILMGCLAEGMTTIWNPHIRPEIIDMIDMLKSMGVKICVKGQESIEVYGIEGLSTPCIHTCIPDNMEALTFAIAAAITGGEVEIINFPFSHLEIPMIYLRESGMKFYKSSNTDSLIVKKGNIYPIEIATGPYPSLNSDMQPLFAAYSLFAKGISKIVDLRFAGRYSYYEEFKKLGAVIYTNGDILVIEGNNKISGAITCATDLRAGAALILAGLGIDGVTVIENFEQVLRGYDNFIIKLKSLGGNIIGS